MITELTIFIAIAVLFFLGLLIKEKVPKLCPICLAVSTMWAVLLIAKEIGVFNNDVLISILLGGSMVGFYYLIESKIKPKLQIFRLPILLTLFAIAYSLIIKSLNFKIIIFILFLWIFFALLRTIKNVKTQKILKKIIECCKNW